VSGLSLHVPTIETPRLRLRAPTYADWPAFDAYFASERSRWNGGPMEDQRARHRIYGYIFGQWILRGYGQYVIADRATDRPIGAVGIWHPIQWPEPEMGWTLWDPATEGRGLAFEAAGAALADAFDRVGMPTLVSFINPANARSIALAERLGALRDEAAPTPFDDPTLVFRHAPGSRPA
jgi:RimJ/RimL family protein N-acetyltransferase